MIHIWFKRINQMWEKLWLRIPKRIQELWQLYAICIVLVGTAGILFILKENEHAVICLVFLIIPVSLILMFHHMK